MYSAVTSLFIKSLAAYRNKSVTVYYTGGVHSTALLLGLKAAGVKKINLVYFNLGEVDHANHEQDLLAVRNISCYLNMPFTNISLKLAEGTNWKKNGAVDKLSLLVQQGTKIIGDSDHLFIATNKPLLLKLRGVFNKAKKVESTKSKATVVLPVSGLSTSKCVSIVADLSDILQYENIPRLISCCTCNTGYLLINSLREPCGTCDHCKALGTSLPYFGCTLKSIVERTILDVHYLYQGKEKLLIVKHNNDLVCVTIDGNTVVRELFSTEMLDENYKDISSEMLYVDQWNILTPELPQGTSLKHIEGLNISVAKDAAIERGRKLKLATNGIIELMDTRLKNTVVLRKESKFNFNVIRSK